VGGARLWREAWRCAAWGKTRIAESAFSRADASADSINHIAL
jgi:hypothetical protein